MRHLALLLPLLALTACPDKTYLYPYYCGNNDGDAYCAREEPEHPYCVIGFQECFDAAGLSVPSSGCVAEMPTPECYTPCGIDNGDDCIDPTGTTESSSSGSTTDEPSSSTEGETETEGPTTTTGPECSGNEECMDPALPFCVGEVCSACSAVVDGTPDEACAGLDQATPLCIEDRCVACAAENAGACGGGTPICDVGTNTCVGCRFHEECQDLDLPACNIATGACFSADAVTEVDASDPDTIQPAIDAVANGAEHAIRLIGGGSLHTVTIDGGKTIAIVSDSSTVRSLLGSTASPIITVNGAGSTAYLHRLRIDGSSGVGISVGPAGTLYADSTQVSGNDGGGVTLATGSSGFLRNSMVAGMNNSDAVASNGSLDLLYTTVGGNFGASSTAVSCSGGSATIRNSILVSRSSDAVDCAVGTITSSFEAEGGAYQESWFDLDAGDLSLASPEDFADAATWQDGDPPFDFEGDDRPATDGSPDYPGADVP